jgi:hypothetical protein
MVGELPHEDVEKMAGWLAQCADNLAATRIRRPNQTGAKM